MTKTTEPKTIEHKEGDETSLPSMHIDHSAVFVNEITVRIGGFDTGIAAVVADMEGLQKQFETEQAERASAHAKKIEERHRLKRDLERGRRMAMAAQAAYGEDMPPDVEREE